MLSVESDLREPEKFPRPAPALTPTAAATQTPANAPRIFLQAGAFSSRDNAERLRQRLEQGLARSVRAAPAATAAGTVHRVQVGPLASVEVADSVSVQMHKFGITEPLVVIE